MSRRKHQRKSRRKRTGNTLVFKLVDPILQSMLFIFFIYCLDANSGFSHQLVLLLMLGLQMLSLATNFFIQSEEQLKKERLFYLVAICLYLVVSAVIMKGDFKYLFIIGPQADTMTNVLTAGIIVLSFWYFIICFREVRSLLTSQHAGDYE